MKVNIIDRRSKGIADERKKELYKILRGCEEAENIQGKVEGLKIKFFRDCIRRFCLIVVSIMIAIDIQKTFTIVTSCVSVIVMLILIAVDYYILSKDLEYEYENNIGSMLRIYDELYGSGDEPNPMLESRYLMKIADTCWMKNLISPDKFEEIVKKIYYQFYCNILLDKCGTTVKAIISQGNILEIANNTELILFEVNEIENPNCKEADLVLLDNGSILREKNA